MAEENTINTSEIPSDDDRRTTTGGENNTPPADGANREREAEAPAKESIVRLFKTIVLNPEDGRHVDPAVVSFKYYNAFNYSLLIGAHENVTLAFGVTSPNPGEGKTVVAANLAVSLAIGHQRETILVDLNLNRPRLHDVFGTKLSPGLVEAFGNGSIHVTRTAVEHLFVLPAGNLEGRTRLAYQGVAGRNASGWRNTEHDGEIGLEYMMAFRDVIYSLEHEFDFIVVDMPSLASQHFPLLFTNFLNGLLVVIQAGKTKRTDLDKILKQLNERQVLGFVFNHVTDEHVAR